MPNKIVRNKINQKPVRKIIKKRRKKSKMYFGTPVHNAIVEYNNSEDTIFRHRIYTEEIHPAFLKLAENIINTYKFSYMNS